MKGEKIENVVLSSDGMKLNFDLANRRPGRVYDLIAKGLKNIRQESLLHAESYYTLNELLK
jgi:hypothetical protein